MKICFDQFEYHIEIFVVVGLDDSLQPHDVGVVELVQDGHFPIGSLGIDFVLKGVEHLL